MNARRLGRSSYVAYVLLCLVAAVAGFSLFQMTSQLPVGQTPDTALTAGSELIGTKRPAFSLPNLEDKLVSIGRWNGDLLLVNFWATWCSPCRKEMPAIAALQADYKQRGFQVVGVAIDSPKAVIRFTKDLGVHYPQLVGQQNAIAIASRYGNQQGALPYSVLIDRRGIIRFIKLGALSKEELKTELLKLL
jgi:peroxiredoxin